MTKTNSWNGKKRQSGQGLHCTPNNATCSTAKSVWRKLTGIDLYPQFMKVFFNCCGSFDLIKFKNKMLSAFFEAEHFSLCRTIRRTFTALSISWESAIAKICFKTNYLLEMVLLDLIYSILKLYWLEKEL